MPSILSNGELIWAYRHDEKGRLGARAGSGWGVSYWTDGKVERILYVTRSYQMISLDLKTGRPDPTFGDGTEVDLRNDFDHTVDPKLPVLGLHAAPLIVKDIAVIGVASSNTGPGYLRGFDVRTGKRKWIFHNVPLKGEFGYDTFGRSSPARRRRRPTPACGCADVSGPGTGHGLDMPAWNCRRPIRRGVTRWGDALFTESLVALDIETGERKWHYQTEHHGMWDRDICSAATLFDMPYNGKMVKVLGAAHQAGFPVRAGSHHRQADLAGDRKAGAQGRCARRMVSADPALAHPAAGIWITARAFRRTTRSDFDNLSWKRARWKIFRALVASASSIRRRWWPSWTIPTDRGARSSRLKARAAPIGRAAPTIPRPAFSISIRKRTCRFTAPACGPMAKLYNGLAINGVGRGTNDNMGAQLSWRSGPGGDQGRPEPIRSHRACCRSAACRC